MAEVKWIKIVTDVFNNKKIKQIDVMPEADAILVVWFKLLCLAGNINENGLIILTKDIPYTDEMLAAEFRKPINIVRLALKTFEAFGMIELIDNIYLISNWEKYQNVEGLEKIRSQTRLRVGKHREKQKSLPCNATCNVTVTQGNATDIDIELDKDIDIEKDNICGGNPTDPPKKKSKFKIPTLEEVQAYCFERNNNVDAEKWHDHYITVGWMVGKNPMRDWKASVRTWEKGNNSQPKKPVKPASFDDVE